ncbi:MAG: helicase [Chitinophagaceae bacterium]|nr:MAG: helicase [Chitinophagaceae bacterium]
MEGVIEETKIAAIAARFINSTGRHVFLTGKAGTGKTTFLKQIVHKTYKKTIIVAPTGIAALNAGGVTIHSLFQLPLGAFLPVDNQFAFNENIKINTPSGLHRNHRMQSKKRRMLQELELLIIDEVSMLRADLLDAIDAVLRRVRRKNTLPFGGVQVLFIGDLLQLPPVIQNEEWEILKNYYDTLYFFDALALKKDPPVYIELDKIFRQADETFIRILNNLRNNEVTEDDYEILNSHYRPDFKPAKNEHYIQLTTHNAKADNLNRISLKEINQPSFFYKASITGEFSEYAYPVEENLELKEGAQVMFIKNDPSGQGKFYNGKIGTIASLDSSEIYVKFNDGTDPVVVEKYSWENIRYSMNQTTNEIEEEVKGTFSQFPIKLAWAITIHKSQGLTFEKAIIDIGRAFAPGQVYVALSRLRSLSGLVLSTPVNYNSLQIDDNIKKYSEEKPSEKQLNHIFKESTDAFFQKYILQCFDFSELSFAVNQHAQSYDKEANRSVKQDFHEWALNLQAELREEVKVANKFKRQLENIFTEDNYLPLLTERVSAAYNHFTGVLNSFSAKIKDHINSLKNKARVKSYLNELKELDAVFYKQHQSVHKALSMCKTISTNHQPDNESIHTRELDENRKKSEVKIKSGKPKKGESRELSFNLYKSNNSIEETAKERGLAITTIEGHLSYYVSEGKLDVLDFLSKEKLNNILKASETLETEMLNEIKQHLGDEYTYTDLRFAIAYKKTASN